MLRRIGYALALTLGAPAAAMAEGMPQLNFANPLTIDQVWWGAGIFLVFLLLCWRWGLPQVSTVLEQRAASIAADLDRAHRLKGEADQAAAEMAQATARARAEAQASINATLDSVKQQGAAQAAELDARLHAQLREAEQRIATARHEAMRVLRVVATDAAETVVQRLTGVAAEPDRVERAVARTLAARGQG
jgi:F-type H+-transporting ATPase subunit b